MLVLLVDDEENVLRSMVRLFRRQPGYALVAVATAAEALEKLASTPFDAAIVDHHLVGAPSGDAVLELIAERWPRVRRILFSGGGIDGDDEGATDHAHAVLMKPATVDEVIAALGGPPAAPGDGG
jgi:ActR/RegA family two-component response regulator